MALQKTNLVLRGAPLPPDFHGTPQDLYQAMIQRLAILSPVGTNFIVVGDTEPSSNVGPWLRTSATGASWWVFSAEAGQYVPVDISPSETPDFFVGPTDPGTPPIQGPFFWIRTAQDRVAGIYGWNGAAWLASGNISNNGATAARPTSPAEFEQFFDSEISTMLIFERGSWRTLSGSPGDVKQVTTPTLAAALLGNPGWALLGMNDQTQRGRLLGMAAKDPGATPAASYATDSGITVRASGEMAGSETHVLISGEIQPHTHLMGHATALNSDNNGQFHRVDNGETIAIPAVIPPNYFQINGEGGTNGTHNGTAGNGPTGTMLITSRQLSSTDAPAYTGTSDAHNNLPQCLFLWTLVKL